MVLGRFIAPTATTYLLYSICLPFLISTRSTLGLTLGGLLGLSSSQPELLCQLNALSKRRYPCIDSASLALQLN